MEQFDVFTARELRNKSGELLKDAEDGQISLITKHGKPAILAVPFDKRLLIHGILEYLANYADSLDDNWHNPDTLENVFPIKNKLNN